MADYTQFLTRAVAALDPNTPEQRQALYDRARRALVDKLRGSDPTLANTDLAAESAALEAVDPSCRSGRGASRIASTAQSAVRDLRRARSRSIRIGRR